MKRIAMLALCATLAGGGSLHAESAFDLVFRTGTLDDLTEGAELHYQGESTADVPAQEDWREVVVGLGPDNSATVQGHVDQGGGVAKPLGSFNAQVGNPVVMVFLERTVRTISEATGGSPFYIRNRIRDSLAGRGEVASLTVDWNGEAVPATQVALAPFVNDAHRADLGAYADLKIRIVMSDAVPGWYHSIRTEAPAAGAEAFHASSLALSGVEE